MRWLERMNWRCVLVGVVVLGGGAERASAKPGYLADFRTAYPAVVGSRIDACGACHTAAIPQLNSYGSAYDGANRQFAPIEGLDSDGDGALNLEEIVALTFPGDGTDVPELPTPTPTATPLSATPTATPDTGPCAGDCNANGVVTVNELLRAVNIALGSAAVDVCTSVDGDGNGTISITELLRAVRAALDGCQ
ncbi:MAG: hypothetical protein ACRERC_08460 [Candidatus Binatia bacterium]